MTGGVGGDGQAENRAWEEFFWRAMLATFAIGFLIFLFTGMSVDGPGLGPIRIALLWVSVGMCSVPIILGALVWVVLGDEPKIGKSR